TTDVRRSGQADDPTAATVERGVSRRSRAPVGRPSAHQRSPASDGPPAWGRTSRRYARKRSDSRSPLKGPFMRVGVLTGGGDCPGLNAVIRAVVRKGTAEYGYEFLGFRDGWRGPLENYTMELGVPQVRGILPRGGTILGCSRTNPFKVD